MVNSTITVVFTGFIFLVFYQFMEVVTVPWAVDVKPYVARLWPFETKKDIEDWERSIFSHCHLSIHDPWGGGINKTYQDKDPLVNCNKKYVPATSYVDGKIAISKNWGGPVEYCMISCPTYDWKKGYDAGKPAKLLSNKTMDLKCELVYAECFHGKERLDRYLHIRLMEQKIEKKKEQQQRRRPDVHIILIDSCSSTLARRAIPKTLNFIEKEMGGVFMHHLNRVGDNTQPNGFAFLFGKRIYSSSRSYLGAKDLEPEWNTQKACKTSLDNETMILHEYEAAGYRTAHITDWGEIFYYPSCKGYSKQPTQHYYRAIINALQKNKDFPKHLEKNCREEFHALMEYHAQFAAAYKNIPKIAYTALVVLIHNNANSLHHTDDWFEAYFRRNAKAFANSFVFFMGDHGPRIGPTIGSPMGQWEINNPMLMVTVPEWLRNDTTLMANLKDHSTKLVTHFDVYATLQDILKNAYNSNFTNFDYEQILKPNPNNGTSLLRPRGPFEDRNCQNVPIAGDYCLCEFNKTEKNYNDMGQFSVNSINEYLESEMLLDLCVPLKLVKVESVSVFTPERETHLHEITFKADPNGARFKARIRLDEDGKYVASGLPVRLNAYKSTADCVAAPRPDARPYCYCQSNLVPKKGKG